MRIKMKAAPQWWGEATTAPCVVEFYDWTVAHVDGHFVVEVDDDQGDEVRGRMAKELPVDDSEKESGKASSAKPAPADGKD